MNALALGNYDQTTTSEGELRLQYYFAKYVWHQREILRFAALQGELELHIEQLT